MSNNDDGVIDRALYAFARRFPGRVMAATALLLYPGLGLILPLLVGMPNNWFFSVNLISVVAAGAVGLTWFVVQLERSHRRHLVDWTTNLRLLSAEEFEWFVGRGLPPRGLDRP